jgi:WD40 repeat protein
VTFSPDGQTLASGSWDDSVRLWDVGTRKQRSSTIAHIHRVTCVAFSPDGKLLATGGHDATIKLWRVNQN